MKIVYIASLGHSGSTILDMSLGCSEGAVGLGEVFWILNASRSELGSHKRFNDARCSCGAIIAECEFWKDVKCALDVGSNLNSIDKYDVIIDRFQHSYGENIVLIDSSKKTNEYLIHLNEIHALKVIFLVRDIRSWSYSRNSRHGISRFKLAMQWYRGNKRLLKFLTTNGLDFTVLGYEEYALYPEYMLRHVCNFADIEFDTKMLTPGLTNSHVLNGNVAKGDEEKRKGILYDARWMTVNSSLFANPFASPIMKFNQKYVYSNFMKGNTNAFGVTQRDFLFFGDRKKEELINQGWGLK